MCFLFAHHNEKNNLLFLLAPSLHSSAHASSVFLSNYGHTILSTHIIDVELFSNIN